MAAAITPGRHPYSSTGTILALLCPESFEMGLDLSSWKTGSSFRGVKLLPPGTHLFASSLSVAEGKPDAGTTIAAPASFFVHLHEGDVAVCAWSKKEECVLPPSLAGSDDDGSVEPAMLDNAKKATVSLELDRFLGAAFSSSGSSGVGDDSTGTGTGTRKAELWSRLSCWIAPAVIERLQPAATRKWLSAADKLKHDEELIETTIKKGRSGNNAMEEDDDGHEVGASAAATGEILVVPDADEEDEHGDEKASTAFSTMYSRIKGVGPAATPADRSVYGVDTSQALRGIWEELSKHEAKKQEKRRKEQERLRAQQQLALASKKKQTTVTARSSCTFNVLEETAAPPLAASSCPCCRLAAAAGDSLDSCVSLQLLGELQFVFASFLVGQSYSALLQWKHLVDVLCRCEEEQLKACSISSASSSSLSASGSGAADVTATATATTSLPFSFFRAALRVICDQLPLLPSDFFSDDLSKSNFLGQAMAAITRTATIRAAALNPAFLQDVAALCDAAGAAFKGWNVPGADKLKATIDAMKAGPAGVGIQESTAAGGGSSSSGGGYRDVGALLDALRDEGGDDDLPAIVFEGGE